MSTEAHHTSSQSSAVADSAPNDPFAALAEAGMARGMRFDPPPPEPAASNLEHVLQDVEHLSHGIDAMLKSASASGVAGTTMPPAVSAPAAPVISTDHADEVDDDIDHLDDAEEDDDDEIMRLFDEDEPSDIHAIDRMLAQQAERLVGSGAPVEAADDLLLDEDCESDVLKSPAFAAPSMVATAAMTDAADALDAAVANAAEESGVLAVIGEPTMQPVMTESPSPAAAVSNVAASMPDAATFGNAAAQGPIPDPTVFANAAAPATATANTTGAKAIAARSPLTAAIRATRGCVIETLAIINLPLSVAPPSLRPIVNVLAVTLALWAPAIWLLAPRLAERAAAASSASDSASADKAHHESALREESATPATPASDH